MPKLHINTFLAILDIAMNLCQSYIYIGAFNYIGQGYEIITKLRIYKNS